MNQMLKDLLPLLTTIGALAAIVHHFVVIVGKNHEFQRKQMYLLSLELSSTRKEISTLAVSIRQIREKRRTYAGKTAGNRHSRRHYTDRHRRQLGRCSQIH